MGYGEKDMGKGILGFYVGNMFLLLSEEYRTREIKISITGSCVDYQLHLALFCPIREKFKLSRI